MDLISIILGLAITLNVSLGTIVLINNRGSVVNSDYFLLVLAVSSWTFSNFMVSQTTTVAMGMVWAVLGYISAIAIAFSFFFLSYHFPRETFKLSSFDKIAIMLATLIVAASVFIPGWVIDRVIVNPWTIVTGRGVLAVFLYFILLLSIGFVLLISKLRGSLSAEEKGQVKYIFYGTVIASILGVVFNLFIPLVLGNYQFVRIGPVFTLVMVGFIGFAILKHHLFNVKIIATELFTAALWIFVLLRTLFAYNTQDRLIEGSLLVLTIVVGIFLVRSVILEVEQRELIEKQEKDLEMANKKQETLLHFISHEIKGYLARGEAAFAGIAQGDFGAAPEKLQSVASTELEDMRKGVDTVMNLLSASDLKRGTVRFDKTAFNFRTIATQEIERLRPAAYEKHLGLDVSMAEGAYSMVGDAEKIREHVIRNLIDNAIKYTPSGTVRIQLSDGDGKIHFSVEDSGVGITPDDMARLFTEGGHGKDSIKVNVHSTGYGLFIAKEVVDAHHGRIWAESEGQGKGARFVVELPAT